MQHSRCSRKKIDMKAVRGERGPGPVYTVYSYCSLDWTRYTLLRSFVLLQHTRGLVKYVLPKNISFRDQGRSDKIVLVARTRRTTTVYSEDTYCTVCKARYCSNFFFWMLAAVV